MWYEILPCFGIMVAAMSFGGWATGAIPNLVHGHWFMRQLITPTDINTYLRDERLTGCPYKTQGLEAIPDEEQAKQ